MPRVLTLPKPSLQTTRRFDHVIDKFHPLAKGLRLAYLGRNVAASKVQDSSLFANSGSYNGGLGKDNWYWDKELNRYAIGDFDSDDSGILFSELDFNAVPMTVGMWWWRDVNTDWQNSLGGNASTSPRFQAWKNEDTIYIYNNINSANWTSVGINTGEWHHALFRFNGGVTNELFIDGVSKGAKTVTASRYTWDAWGTGGARSYGWDGYLADLMIWGRELSDQEIRWVSRKTDPLMHGLLKPLQVARPNLQPPHGDPHNHAPRTTVLIRQPLVRERKTPFRLNKFHPMAKGLLFAWLGEMPGGKTVFDSSVYANNAPISGAASNSWEIRANRQGFLFDDVDDFALPIDSKTDGHPFTDLGEKLTVSFWMYPHDVNDPGSIWYSGLTAVELRTENGSGQHVPFGIGPNLSKLRLNVADGGGASYENEDSATTLVINTLYHVACTINGDDWEIWLDGKLDASGTFATATGDRSVGSTICNLSIGSRTTNSGGLANTFDGWLADVMIWDRPLSGSEIRTLANEGDPMLGGLIAPAFRPRISNQSPPPPLTGGILQSIPGPTQAATGTAPGLNAPARTAAPRSTPLIRYPLVRERPAFFRMNKFHPLAKGLLFGWFGNMMSREYAIDDSVFGNRGVLTNMDPPTDWLFANQIHRQALYMVSGSSQYFEVPHRPYLAHTGAVSCGLWFRWTTALGALDHILSRWDTGANERSWSLYYDNPNFAFTVTDTGAWAANRCSYETSSAASTTLKDGDWHHMMGQFTPGSNVLKIWVDAEEVGVATTYTDTCNATHNNTQPLGVGCCYTSGTDQRHTTGEYADVVVYNRILREGEIRTLANANNPMMDGLLVPIWQPRGLIPVETAITGDILQTLPRYDDGT